VKPADADAGEILEKLAHALNSKILDRPAEDISAVSSRL